MIVLTTPTGAIGQQLLEQLVAAQATVRVIARDTARLPQHLRDQVEVVPGSHGDTAVVQQALQGAAALFWLVPPNPAAKTLEKAYLDFTRPVCEAIQQQSVARIVSVSALGRGTPWEKSAGLVTAALQMDDLLAGTGAHLRSLTMPSFMDNVLQQVETIRDQGLFFSPIDPERKLPTCSTGDIAAAAARLLLDLSWTGQQEHPVLGPEDLSGHDMARIISEVLGRPVRCQHATFEAFEQRLQQSGMSPGFVEGYVAMMRAKDAGVDNTVPRTAATSSPTAFRAWCEASLKPAVLG